MLYSPPIFTVRNEVAKVMFLHLSVILFTGRGLPQCMLGYHPLGAGTPRTRHPPGSRHPPRADTPPTRHPAGSRYPLGTGTPLEQTPPWSRDGYCCGRYASYWNAFLFIFYFYSSIFLADEDDLTDKIDFIICLGGDGTLLYASSLFQVKFLTAFCFT